MSVSHHLWQSGVTAEAVDLLVCLASFYSGRSCQPANWYGNITLCQVWFGI